MNKPIHERVHDLLHEHKMKFGVDATILYIGSTDFLALRQSKEYAQQAQVYKDEEKFMGLKIVQVARGSYLAVA